LPPCRADEAEVTEKPEHGVDMADTAGGPKGPRQAHILTVDVEEYFHGPSLEDRIQPGEWESLPARIQRGVDPILELLDRHGATATFFVVGWIARAHPRVVEMIVEAGHEVGSHGHLHRSPMGSRSGEIRQELEDSRKAIEDACGQAVRGYRAPGTPLERPPGWIYPLLAEAGYRYSSSARVSPWDPSVAEGCAPWRLVRTKAGSVIEIPNPSIPGLHGELALMGGSGLRLLPPRLFDRLLEWIEAGNGSTTFLIRSWELDPGIPRLATTPFSRFARFRNLESTRERVDRLLARRSFQSVAEGFAFDRVEEDVPELEGRGDSLQATG
jgi:polysaccharide deacetylase family protein (PEP-CTERM system associated)